MISLIIHVWMVQRAPDALRIQMYFEIMTIRINRSNKIKFAFEMCLELGQNPLFGTIFVINTDQVRTTREMFFPNKEFWSRIIKYENEFSSFLSPKAAAATFEQQNFLYSSIRDTWATWIANQFYLAREILVFRVSKALQRNSVEMTNWMNYSILSSRPH